MAASLLECRDDAHHAPLHQAVYTPHSRTGAHDDLLQALSLAMHHSLLYHRGDRCRRIPYKEPVPVPVAPGPAPKVFGLDPDMGPAEDSTDDDGVDEGMPELPWAPLSV